MLVKFIEDQEHYRNEDDRIGDPGIYTGLEILRQLDIYAEIGDIKQKDLLEMEVDIIDIRDDGGTGWTIA